MKVLTTHQQLPTLEGDQDAFDQGIDADEEEWIIPHFQKSDSSNDNEDQGSSNGRAIRPPCSSSSSKE